MRRILTSIIITLLFGSMAKAQEGIPVYFDYLADNYYLVYPSMAGIADGTKIRLTARKQWFNVDEAPSLQTLNINSRVGERSGIGGILFNDSNGYHSQTGFKATYAHHLQLGGDFRTLNQLSFGLSAGVIFGTVWAGLSYRRSFDGAQFQSNGNFGEQRLQLFTPIIGVNVNRFMFSYNYSYQSGDIRFDNGGFHQITLGYEFGQSDDGKRYDCYCPAANN